VIRLLTVLALFALACVRAGSGPDDRADRVLRHGRVYVGDAAGSYAESLAIRDGLVVYIGSDDGVEEYIGPDTRVAELGGRSVTPGFHDAHVHPMTAGLEMSRCPLPSTADVVAIEAQIRACAATKATGSAWLLGGGWELTSFPDGNPRAERLDALVPDRPAFLLSADGHSAWANARALEAAGISAATPDPPGGRIERDARTGKPSGTLRESAIALVANMAPSATQAELGAATKLALRSLAQVGIVCAHEANATPQIWNSYLATIPGLEPLPRIRAALELPDDWARVDPLPALIAARERRIDPRARVVAVKLFLDGVIETRTAALLEPYVGSDERGHANFTPDALDALVTRLDAAGFQVHMHAIGDRAVRMGLDAVEAARAANGPRDARHTIAHLEMVSASDLPRFRALGVVPNIQALWAQDDAYIQELTIPRIGDERALDLYPIGSLFATGAVVAAGSDWPVTSPNPLEAIEVGITRRAEDATTGPGWLPEQRATFAQMLGAYTRGGAWLDFEENERGTLEVGRRADLLVFDRDLEALPPEQLSDARVVETVADGVTIWSGPSEPER
jgi:predicted amidohydrolase YtcJ